ncbi:hydroxymethylbilane synthase [Caldanaerobius polysaccharolyticus]|uniref:hydroxymethylbilane synthase n=1 Tax=Caldanaerobius polysaccharolyticus TaxID=44256 RepID=UPI00047A693E|nr:hydroxymethylbilane synthase [Caldanaerobius polysaccharolyticus]
MRIRIGSRASKLALLQAQIVVESLKSIDKNIDFEVVKISTSGDRWTNRPLSEAGGKGLFVKEIEKALLERDIDIAVHSMKDVPGVLPEGLFIAAVLEREDPRDVLVCNRRFFPVPLFAQEGLKGLGRGAKIGTSSLRRAVQLKDMDDSVEVVPLRGNVDSRLRKMEELGLDGIIVAAAGLKRLGMGDRIDWYIPVDVMVPAVGQGALAVEMREKDPLYEVVKHLNHRETEMCVRAERAFMMELGGNCSVAIGAYATVSSGKMVLLGMSQQSGKVKKEEMRGEIFEPESLGKKLAKRLTGQT